MGSLWNASSHRHDKADAYGRELRINKEPTYTSLSSQASISNCHLSPSRSLASARAGQSNTTWLVDSASALHKRHLDDETHLRLAILARSNEWSTRRRNITRVLLLWPSSALLASVSLKSITCLSSRLTMAALQSSAVFRRTNCEQWARVAGWGQSLTLLASSSARSFPGITTWEGIHWATTFIPNPRSFSINHVLLTHSTC